MWITALVVFILIVFDQLSKFLVVQLNVVNQTVIPNVLTLKLTYNPGAAWGMLENNTWVLLLVSLIAGVILGYLCKKNDWRHGKVQAFAMSMAFAGCIGNLFDRFYTVVGLQDGVIDMVSFGLFDWFMGLFHMSASIFNVADMYLVIGLIIIMVDYLFFYEKRMMKYGNENNG